jgi:hypothetical protein
METELLNERFDVPEPDIWHAISLYSTEFLLGNPPGPWGYSDHEIVDPRNCREWHGDYDGIPLAISFPRDKDKLIWFGVTQINSGQWGRCEHLLGFLEVRRVMITSDIHVEVRIVCCRKPFYLFFSEMADALITRFHRQPVHLARSEVLNFKSLVERQTYKDILVDGKPQEAIARSNLQHFLVGRSYRETPVRGGRADLLVFSSQGRFLYETKIWRGKTYFDRNYSGTK